MILKALNDYYDRSIDTMPPFGMEYKEIGFLLVINREGKFLRFEDRLDEDKKHAQEFLVKEHVGRSNGSKPNYLYDSISYVLGYSEKGAESKTTTDFNTFKNEIEKIYVLAPNNTDLKALHNFYQQTPAEILNAIQEDCLWEEIKKYLNKKYSTFSFLVEGDTQIIAEKAELLNLWNDHKSQKEGRCLVTGDRKKIINTTRDTMIAGSQATAKLVSFQKNSGYDSYGKEQGSNAPISDEADFKASTALKFLISTKAHNSFKIGNRTYIFWASNNEVGEKVQEGIWQLFNINDKNEDDPNRRIEEVKKVFNSIQSGFLRTDLNDKFYILGLAPNAARIATTYWAEIPLKDFAKTICNHFEDMTIIDTRKEKKPYMGLYSILSTVTQGGKVSDVSPNLPDAVIKSIFQGSDYPYSLYNQCIRRIRAQDGMKVINITRAAIIKAYLNRKNNNKIKVMLDKENTNAGYLCGRLFAVLDKIQYNASNQNSIQERYMNAASTTPSAVFATILNLSSHHSEKLNSGQKIYFEKIKQEIISKLDSNGFPSHLDLQDQGRFFVGFYHQEQDFFTKKETTEVKETNI